MRRNPTFLLLLFTVHCVLFTGLTGCESFQRKFVRKPKQTARVTPIINFQDYTRAMTPMDRYRKHYALFDYWNAELLSALETHATTSPGIGQPGTNPKRIKLASEESLQELKALQDLLQDATAAQLTPLVDAREQFDRQLQTGSYSAAQLSVVSHNLEAQTRRIQRELYWRNVEDLLKADATAPVSPPDTTPDASGH